jgi:hypothetical protein
MYIGKWNYDIKQNFTMGALKEDSWADRQRKKGLRHTIYNSSSYAFDDLLRHLRKQKPVYGIRLPVKRFNVDKRPFTFFEQKLQLKPKISRYIARRTGISCNVSRGTSRKHTIK